MKTAEERIEIAAGLLTISGTSREQIHELWEQCLSRAASPGKCDMVMPDGTVETVIDNAGVFYLVINHHNLDQDCREYHEAIDRGIDKALADLATGKAKVHRTSNKYFDAGRD